MGADIGRDYLSGALCGRHTPVVARCHPRAKLQALLVSLFIQNTYARIIAELIGHALNVPAWQLSIYAQRSERLNLPMMDHFVAQNELNPPCFTNHNPVSSQEIECCYIRTSKLSCACSSLTKQHARCYF